MKLEVNINKKIGVGIIASFLVLAGIIFVAAVWVPGEHNVWHDSNDVKITIDDVDYSLKEAVDDNLLGGLNPSVGGTIDFKVLGSEGWQNIETGNVLVQWAGNCRSCGRFNVDVDYDGNGWVLFTQSIWGTGDHDYSFGSLILPPNGKIRVVKTDGNSLSNAATGAWQKLG